MRPGTALLAAIVLLALPGAADGANFDVTRTDDPPTDGCANNGCSLREALNAANTADGNSVTVPPSATAYTLTAGDFTVTRTMTIQGGGAGSTTVSGDADNRIITFNATGKTLTITGLTLSNGHAPVDGGGNAIGGGIRVVNGALVVQSSIVTGNVAAGTTGNGRGGGIDVANAFSSASLTDTAVTGNQATSASGGATGGGLNAVTGSLTLVSSSVTGNSVTTGAVSAFGGGISAQGALSATNSTVSGNSATATGGGSSVHGGGISAATATDTTMPLKHVTVVGNTLSGTARVGGNIEAINSADITLTGSIVSGGTAGAGSENCFVNGANASIVSLGFNLEDRNQCGLAAAERHDTDPQLQALGPNGGLTPTHAIPFGSPARDAGGSCGLATDQRGLPRVGPCDIGTFEYQPSAPVVAAAGDRATAAVGQAVGFTASATDADPGDPVTLVWSFDDGTTATGATASHAFATPGSHTATVTATDSTGLQATATVTVAVTAPATGDGTPPGLSGLAFLPAAFPASNSGASVRAARARPPARRPRATGSKVSYRLTEAATVTFTVERAVAGRRVNRRCVRLTRANRTRPRCTRFVAVRGSFTHAGKAGANSFRFTGRVGGRKLAPGSYRLLARARDAAGNRSRVVRRAFRIVP